MVDMPTSARAASVVLLPQRPAADLPLAVERLVELGCLRREGGAAAALVAEAIERFGLEDLRDRPVASLSAGQAQRAHLARVWSQRSSNAVLVLDEPTAPLDHRWAGRVWAMLHEHAGAGGSVLVAVHDLAVAADAADEAWLLRDGTLAASGPGEAVLQPERLEEAFEAGFEWAPRGDGSRWLVPSTSSV
jgi:ABC-type cobalamin/Fe3+-siderophores transport system ATPase subunit